MARDVEKTISSKEGKNAKPRVFISHSKKNIQRARRLADALAFSGVNVWFDEWEVLVGQTLAERVYSGIMESNFLLILLSKHSVQSRWVREELDFALIEEIEKSSVTILPVLIDECEIPPALRKKRYIKMRDFGSAVSEILAAVGIVSKHSFQESLNEKNEMERNEFAAEGLGRSLAVFMNNVRYHQKYGEVVNRDGKSARIRFRREEFWEKFHDAMQATGTTKDAYNEFVKFRSLKENTWLNGKQFGDLLFGIQNLKHRNDALHYASILDANPLLSRRLLSLFDSYFENPFSEEVVNGYLLLRNDLAQEIGRKHGAAYAALILFYMDLGVVLFIKGDFNCASVAADQSAFEIVKMRLKLAVDSAKHLGTLDFQTNKWRLGKRWSKLFRENAHAVQDLESLYSDLDKNLGLSKSA
jgi:hypothetical protein